MNDPSNPAAELADSQHPWIGLASFTEEDRAFFAGRAGEIDDLVRLVRRDTLTLLYGVSGLGKTSLVQAGLFPALRGDNFLPVPIRLDYLEGAAPLSRQIIDAISAAALAARVEAPPPRPDETLWEYFHREGNHFWSSRNDLVSPLLAFDQFEELFTLGRETPARVAQGSAFIGEFADLVENRPPATLRDDPARAKEFNFKPAPLNVLLAMREDYLADLDRIRSHFRALGQNRLRLLPMGERQARQVIALGASLLAPGVEDRIVTYVAGGAAKTGEMTVAPALLSLVLRELNERRLARGLDAKITSDLLDVEQHKIFEDFYLRTLQDFPAGVRLFIEDELLTASGHRDNCALDDALTRPDVTLPVLNELVNRRLLAYEDRHHTRRVELTHDVLVPVIKASRDSRLTSEALAQAGRLRAEQEAQKRKQRLTLVVACALGLALLATIWGGYYLFVQEHKAYFSGFAKRYGFAVGIGQISEAEARRLSYSFLIVHKGIKREGWKFGWKPAFRLVAVNSLLQPTTNHFVGTYLWTRYSSSEEAEDEQAQERAERLGLQTVCQWEYVSNADGEIIYERALDRDERMVYGFTYSPPGSGPPATRLARFVGPDGFPQLQRNQGAEYIAIHYDSEGWEDRLTYRDGKNLPATGPAGAFEQLRRYNRSGQPTLVLSRNVEGKNMIDNAGNCGMELIYDKKGWRTESRSIGPDLKLMALKEGWAISKHQYDEFGRSRRTTYYGLNEEPVLHRDGHHGWESEYDEHGNEIALTFIGLDAKPTLLAGGFARLRWAYDSQGRITRMSCHGVNGEPVVHKDGHHARESRYDAGDNPIETKYVGLDGKPVLVIAGYAIVKTAYDDHGRTTQQSYYGANGEPLLVRNGYHGWEAQYDERGNEITRTFVGLDGKPVVVLAGYAVVKKSFDSDGNELEAAYFDETGKRAALELGSGIHKVTNTYDGRGKVSRKRFRGRSDEPVLHKDGHHGWDAQYDGRGNSVRTTYVGLDEKPILLPERYATEKSAYDASGKKTRQSLHGVNGESVLHKDGYHGWNAQYDERGRDIAKTYFGLDEKPIRMPDGYATVKKEYDTRGNVTKETYFGVNGEPVLYGEALHGVESQYDERGNAIATTFVGLDGKPATLAAGYARTEKKYDFDGNELEVAYFDAAGKAALRTDARVHRVINSYNPRGKIIRIRFYGVNGEAALHQKGYHGRDEQYDERGNSIMTTYVGLEEKPIRLADGYAIVKRQHDARGKVTRQSYYGVEGDPVLSKEGYHGWEEGKQKEKVYFGVDGKPVAVKQAVQP